MRKKLFALYLVIALVLLLFTGAFSETASSIDIDSIPIEELIELQKSINDKISEAEKKEPIASSDREITIESPDVSLYTGKTLKLKADVTRNVETAPKTTKLVWSSSDINIASVDKTGVVKGISGGNVTIHVEAEDDNSVYADMEISVRASVADISLEEKEIKLLLGGEAGKDQGRIVYSISPENAYDPSVSFSSSNPKVVEVDEEGNLQAKSAGKAVITIKTNDISLNSPKAIKCNVIVNQAVKTIKLKEKTYKIGVKKTDTILTEVLPEAATNKKIIYTSTDENIATVNAKGVVTAINPGTCSIKCEADDGSGVAVFAEIRVYKLATKIEVKDYKPGSTWNLTEGQSKTINFKIQPQDATSKTVRWTTKDPSIVGVSLSGDSCKITAKGPGETTIVGTTTDGSNKSFTIKVFVEGKMSLKYVDVSSYTEWGYHSVVYKFKNMSKSRTVDGLTIKYWGENVYGKKLRAHGFGDYEVEETINITIKPGQTKKTKRVYMYGFTDAKRIHVDLVKVHYTDGKTEYNTGNDFNWYFTY